MRKAGHLMAMLGMGAMMALTATPEIPYERVPHYSMPGRRNVIQRRPRSKASFKQNKRKGL